MCQIRGATVNRIILFRGKTIADYPQWVYGDLIQVGTQTFIREQNNTGEIGDGVYIVDPATVGQFTGLLDRKNSMIFEKDILSSSSIDAKTGFTVLSKLAHELRADSQRLKNCTHALYSKIKMIKKTKQEYILCAALLMGDGTILTGYRHDRIYKLIKKFKLYSCADTNNAEPGFLTSKERFVSRIEAYQIAFQANQIEESNNKPLISEDLY